MTPKKRVELIRLKEKIDNQKEYSKELGVDVKMVRRQNNE